MRRTFFSTFATLLLGGFVALPAAHACDLCAIYTSLETQEAQPGWYLSLFQQYSQQATLREDGDAVANPADQHLDSWITQAVLGYQVNRRLGLQVNLPWIDRSFRRVEGDAVETGSESGLGDVTVLAHFRAYEHYSGNRTFVLNLLAGVKLSTGSSDRIAEELAEDHLHAAEEAVLTSLKHEGEHDDGVPSAVHGHDLALGSGSTDGLLGLSAFGSHGRAFLAAEAQYALRRQGDYQYRYANDLRWSLGAGYFASLSHGHAWRLGVEVNGEKKGFDELAGEPARDTDLSAVYAGPIASYSFASHFYGDLKVDLPVRQQTTELQSVPDYRLRLGVTYRW